MRKLIVTALLALAFVGFSAETNEAEAQRFGRYRGGHHRIYRARRFDCGPRFVRPRRFYRPYRRHHVRRHYPVRRYYRSYNDGWCAPRRVVVDPYCW